MARKKRQLKTAAFTFMAALGIGFVMQYGDALALRMGDPTPVSGPDSRTLEQDEVLIPVSASVALPPVLNAPETRPLIQSATGYQSFPTDETTPTLAAVELASAASGSTWSDTIVLEEATPISLPQDAPKISTPEPGFEPELAPDPVVASEDPCAISLTATPRQSAMVALALTAPCRAEQRVAFHHDALVFHMMTDAAGNAMVEVPALEAEAFFIAAFDDAEGAIALTNVPEVVLFDRSVLIWDGAAALQLHALEFGANYGQSGHFWHLSSGDRMETMLGQAGFVTRLGEMDAAGYRSDVYTFPTGMTGQQGEIALSVEIEVTEDSCGQRVMAQTLQIGPVAGADTRDLNLTLPECDAVGEFVVLKNALEDLTLASR